ncbi:MAG TPA: ATP synthase F1 subunit gamma [Rhodothermales bacterium]|nr:ATP synthase F1 subunit gamma [Rhodothermales bacterium]
MASLRDIRTRIASVKNTQQVTRAMKMVAAAKLRRAQERIFSTRPYAFKLREIINEIQGKVDPAVHDLFDRREEMGQVLVIVVTADRGLAGAFNTNVIKEAESAISGRFASFRDSGHLDLVCIGRKGHEHFKKRGYTLVGDYRGVFHELDFSRVVDIVDIVIRGFRSKRWDGVWVVYNEFRNTISQNRVVEPFLPVPTKEFVTPVMEISEDYVSPTTSDQGVDFIFEPGTEEILEVLLPRYLHFQMWRAMLESNAAEQGARMVAMDNATTNAGELLRGLQLRYNQARQAAITKEILEIASGAEALAKQ